MFNYHFKLCIKPLRNTGHEQNKNKRYFYEYNILILILGKLKFSATYFNLNVLGP